MTRTVQSVLIIIVISLGVMLAVPARHVWAGQSAKKANEVTYSGEHGRNVRVKVEGSSVVIVKGTIYSVRGNTITMDGESFSLPSDKIHDQLGISVSPEQLFPGLEVEIVIKDGSIEGATIKNFVRVKAVTDPKEIKHMRQLDMERGR